MGLHSLRHANATLLDSVGTPLGMVQALLGHSSPEIKRGIYVHSLPVGARETIEKVEKSAVTAGTGAHWHWKLASMPAN